MPACLFSIPAQLPTTFHAQPVAESLATQSRLALRADTRTSHVRVGQGWMTIGWTVVCLLFMMLPVRGENWSGWRGPRNDGITSESKLPLHWSPTERIQWKTEIPGSGHSSPIVWGDAIFVTSATPADLTRHVYRIDRTDGRIVWDRVVGTGPLEPMHEDNSPASATPVTDGESVYSVFVVDGKLHVSAVSLDGMLVWQSQPGTFYSRHGFCTGLVLDPEGRLIVSGLQDGPDAFVAALDRRTGKTIWKVKRRVVSRSYSTPCLCEIDGRKAILLSGADQTIAYDRETGQTLWEVEGPATKTVSSIVVDEANHLAFVCGGRDGNFYALRTALPAGEKPAPAFVPDPDNRSDAAFEPTPTLKQRLVWKSTKGIPYMTSPLLSQGRLHIFSDEGIYNCYEAKTGRVLKTVRAVGTVRASMIANSERIYLTEENGTTTIFQNDATWTVLARNELSETVIASPAVAPGQLLIRGVKHLYAIH